MSCPGENTLADYVGGTLTLDRHDSVQQHVADCESCHQLFDQLRSRADLTLLRALDEDRADRLPDARFGRYLMRRQLGAGGMGVVFEAEDLLLGRAVALKLLHRDAAGSVATERQARLVREAQALARLAHPNVVTVYDVGVEHGRVFLAMEYIAGGTLGDFMRQRPRAWDEVLGAYHQAALGLAAAHDAGIIHRDFKPANVMASTDGRICVTDFGLARMSDRPDEHSAEDEPGAHTLELTLSGTVLGTPAFMAPEQLLGRPADARSDVFSFCVALFADLYGQRPFDGATLDELRDAILASAIQPRPRYSRVPEWLHRIVVSGLQADPDRRPATMRVVVDHLARERAAAGIDRAARILAEARAFFRGPNAGVAISTVAVSLLSEVMPGMCDADPIDFARPDLEGLAEVEILGDRVEGILANFGPFRLLMSHFVLRELALPTDEDGNIRCEPTRWYPLAPFVVAIHRFERTFGAEASYDVGRASSQKLVGAGDGGPPADLGSLIAAIDGAMIANVRRPDRDVGDAIGHYVLAGGVIASGSPWPCGNDHGLLAGLVAQVAPGAALVHDPHSCRRTGARACHYTIRRA